MYHCNQCEKSFQIISILLYIIFSPEIVKKTWNIDRGIIEFDHFKLQQITYGLKAYLHADYNAAAIIFIRLTTAVINQ